MTQFAIADLLDEPPSNSGLPAGGEEPYEEARPAAVAVESPIQLSVTWGDISNVIADIHVAGHYQGVMPVSAERSLDQAISSSRRVIEEHARRGWLVGALGEISYFPGGHCQPGRSSVRQVALAGMGRLGTLNEQRASQMYASLLAELFGLDGVQRAATTLIGAGAGNLTIHQACGALTAGFGAVVGRAANTGRLAEITIVEIDRLRAENIRLELERVTRQLKTLTVASEIVGVDGGEVSVDSAAVFAICCLARLVRDLDARKSAGRAQRNDAVASVLDYLPAAHRKTVRERLAEISDDYTALAVTIGGESAVDRGGPALRISVVADASGFRWAALTQRSTIPERVVAINRALVAQLIDRMTAPAVADAADLPRLLTRFVVPVDFQRHVSDQAPIVVEVDRETARLPWEFLTDDAFDSGSHSSPLAVRTPLARQMRTTYATTVGEDAEGGELRALVIGDPGDPVRGHSLPQARQEAEEVYRILHAYGARVRLFIGSSRTGAPDAEPATQLDVLKELLGRNYHLIHYAGHGVHDPDDPSHTGWMFADGLLGARELAQLTRAPRLVVANACWTAPRAGANPSEERQAQAALTPVLADEFLRVGVVHYVGTSWRIPDTLALTFAKTFYEGLFGQPAGAAPPTIGDALCRARQGLFLARNGNGQAASPEQWSAWAAYQHYGDPQDVIDLGGRRPDERREPVT